MKVIDLVKNISGILKADGSFHRVIVHPDYGVFVETQDGFYEQTATGEELKEEC